MPVTLHVQLLIPAALCVLCTWVVAQEVSGDWLEALWMIVPALPIHRGLHLTTLVPLSQEPYHTQCLGEREVERTFKNGLVLTKTTYM